MFEFLFCSALFALVALTVAMVCVREEKSEKGLARVALPCRPYPVRPKFGDALSLSKF